MDLVNRHDIAFRNLYRLSNELESKYERFLPGSPTYVAILKDMLERGIEDDRIQPTINAYENIMLELSNDIEAVGILRRYSR